MIERVGLRHHLVHRVVRERRQLAEAILGRGRRPADVEVTLGRPRKGRAVGFDGGVLFVREVDVGARDVPQGIGHILDPAIFPVGRGGDVGAFISGGRDVPQGVGSDFPSQTFGIYPGKYGEQSRISVSLNHYTLLKTFGIRSVNHA